MLKAIKAFFAENIPAVETTEQIIEKIHNEFDTAGEKLLAEAKQILAQEHDTSKGDRLKSLGFTKCASVELASKIKLEKAQSKETAERVQYYQQWYPNQKFITEAIVKQICEKYNLVCAEVSYYKGDVPEKNVAEMEAFKLRDEDKDIQTFSTDDEYYYRMGMERQEQSMGRTIYNPFGFDSSINGFLGLAGAQQRPTLGLGQSSRPRAGIEKSRQQKPFSICAPEKDFDMRNLIRSGHKLELHIPDPIVLQPVKGGYLVVSKWGLEASDELVVNQKMN
jgi:hypothetical protein